MENFLRTIWGNYESGYRCVVTGKMKHEFRELDFEAIQLTDKQTVDVWYAPAILSVAERKTHNVLAVKAFWLDIDIKPEKPGAYHDLTDALLALKGFIEQYDIPQPTIVGSGNGLHVYWILESHIKPEMWQRTASALREACVEFDLLADHGITIDIARILRVPGTKNHKDKSNPKPVSIMTDINTYPYEKISEALSAFEWKAELRQEAKKQNAVVAVDLPQTPKDAGRIAEQCNQLRNFRDTNGNLPEPEWYAGLGVLALCVDGEAIAQEWSSGHPTYSASATSAKFERAREFAPTTCAKFSEVNPAGCKGCPLAGKITTPLQLGETVTPVSIPQETVISTTDGQSIAVQEQQELGNYLPTGYLCGEEGVYQLIEGKDELERKVIFRDPVWVSAVLLAEGGGGSEIEISWIAEGKLETACFKQSLLANDAKFADWLLDQNISSYLQIKHVVPYIRESIHVVQRRFGVQTVYKQFGLNKSGFLIGTDLLQETGTARARVSGSIDKTRVEMMAATGSLDKWIAATELLDNPKFWVQRYTVLAALSSPLFAIIGSEGSVLSIAGDSGTGKTTAAAFGISAYGNPEAFTVDPQTTLKAFYEHWRQVGNLPLNINEANTIPPQFLEPVIYAAANGKARDFKNQDGTMFNSGRWKTLTICTANKHLNDFPDKVLGEALKARIFELPLYADHKIDEPTGRMLSQTASKNFGLAGRVYIDHVMRNRDEIEYLTRSRITKISAGIDSVHRFALWQIGAVAETGVLATKLGLIRFDYEDAIEHAIKHLRVKAASVVSPQEQVRALISEYTRLGKITDKELSNVTAWHKDDVQGEVRGRWNSEHNEHVAFCLPVTTFKTFALEHGLNWQHVKDFMAEHNASIPKGVKLSPETGLVKCYIVPVAAIPES